MSQWKVISRVPLCADRWAQIEVYNQYLGSIDASLGCARVLGTDKWYGLFLPECKGDCLANLANGRFMNPNITYRVFDSELVTFESETGATVTKIAIKGRIARTTLFGQTIVLL